MLLIGQELHCSTNQLTPHQKPNAQLVPNHQKPNQLSANQISALQQSNHQLSHLSTNQLQSTQLSTNQLSPKQTLTNQVQAERERQAQAQLLLLQQQEHSQHPILLTTQATHALTHALTHTLTHTFTHSFTPSLPQPSVVCQDAHRAPLSMPATHTHIHTLSPVVFPPQPSAVTGRGNADLSVRVKEEQSSPLSRPLGGGGGDFESEETPMDTHVAPSSPPTEHIHPHAHPQAVEAELSFDSAFPDLSELITAETASGCGVGVSVATLVSGVAGAAGLEVFPERYVVPPQPSPSSAFIPFPAHAATVGPGGEHGRPANITDFSPEWSYPEVSEGGECDVRLLSGPSD